LLVDLIDANDRVHGEVGSGDVLEFGLDFFLGRVHDNGCALTENQLLDFNESEQSPLANLTSVNFIDLSLAHEYDSVEIFLDHGA
jgi:hypothetical protein